MDSISGQGRIDSKGVFTIDFARAFVKLARFGSVLPHAYLLRAVQAGVAAGADSVRVESSNGKVTFLARAPWPSLQSLLANFREGATPGSRAEGHLIGAMLMSPGRWELKHPQGVLRRDGDEFSIHQLSGQAGDGLSWEFQLPRKEQQAVAAMLAEHARFSPTPVLFGGKPVAGPWSSRTVSRGPLGDAVDLIQALSLCPVERAGFHLPAPPMAELKDQSDCWKWSGKKGWLTGATRFAEGRPCWLSIIDGQVPSIGAAWRLYRAVRRPLYPPPTGRVRLVVDGVTLLPFDIEGLEHLEVLEAGDWATVDLSGLQVVQDERFLAFVDQVHQQAQRMQRGREPACLAAKRPPGISQGALN